MNNGAKDIQPILTPTGAPNLAAVSRAVAPKNVVTPGDSKRRRKITRVETSSTAAQVAKSARHAFEVGVHRYCKSAGMDTDDASSMLSILLMPAADGKIVVAAVREDGMEKKAILPLITGAIGGLLGGGYGAFKNWDKDLGWKERLKQGLMYGAGGAAVGATGGLALGALGGGAAAAGAGTAAAGAGTAAAGGGLLSTVGNLAMPAMVAYQIFGGGGGGGGGAAAEKGKSPADLLRESGGGSSLAGKSPKELDKALKALGLDDEFDAEDISSMGKGKDRRFLRQQVGRSIWQRNQGALGTSIGDIEMQIESGSTPDFEALTNRAKAISGEDSGKLLAHIKRLETKAKVEAGLPPAQRSGGAMGFSDQQPAAGSPSAAAGAAARQLEQDARSSDSSEAVVQGDAARNQQYARQTASSQSRGGSIPQAPARNEFGQQGADEQLMSRGQEYEKWRDNTIFNQKVDEQTSRRMTFPGSADAVQRASSPEGVAMPGSERWKQQTATNTGQAPVAATPGGTMPAQPGSAAAATAAAGSDADLQGQLDSFREQFREQQGIDPSQWAQADRATDPNSGVAPSMAGAGSAPPPGVPAPAAPTTPSTGAPAAAPAAPAASKARIASTGAGISAATSAATGAAGSTGATGATGPGAMTSAPSSLFGPSGSFMRRDLGAGGNTSGAAARKPTESLAVS